MKIIKSKLIYCFDPLNKVNFHRYIDSIDHLLVIIKTKYGAYTAAYSEGGFEKKALDKDGLLISLNQKKFFTLA